MKEEKEREEGRRREKEGLSVKRMKEEMKEGREDGGKAEGRRI